MQDIHYGLILMAAFLGVASPGPATLAIAGMSMNYGRFHGAALAAGVFTGSLFWSFSAAFGLGAVLYANVWLFEVLRYLGAMYLLFLAYKSCRSALVSSEQNTGNTFKFDGVVEVPLRSAYFKGLAIHLTNPKAILFFSALYTLGVPSTVTAEGLLSIIVMIAMQSGLVFFGYAFLFSNQRIRQGYFKMKRAFDGVFAIFFGLAGIKILMSKLSV
jgi:threonine/homoserine/homoserine lactone efflux protein